MAEKLKSKCVLVPSTTTGEESILYKTLLSKYKDRALVNYFYALALQPNVVADLQSKGKQLLHGEVIAEDFIQEYELDKVISDHTTKKSSAAIAVGAMDAAGNELTYDSAIPLMDTVTQFNKNNRAFIASIVRKGNQFVIRIYNRTASNQLEAANIEREKGLWNTVDSVLKAAQIDIESLHAEVPFLISPLQAHQIPQIMLRIKNASELRHLTSSDIRMLLKLGEGSTQVKRLTEKAVANGMNGSLQETADFIYNTLQYPKTSTPGTITLIEATLNKYRQFEGVDLEALSNQVFAETLSFQSTSEEVAIDNTIKELREQYPELNEELIDISNGIKTLRDAAGAALLNLQRERNELERKEGVTEKSLELDKMEDALGEAIQTKNYYIGMLDYLLRAEEVSKSMDEILSHLSTAKDVLTRSRDNATILKQVEEQIAEYMDILHALASTDSNSILIDNSLTEEERTTLQERAQSLLSFFRSKKSYLKTIRKIIVQDMANEILGSAGFSQAAINDIVENEANQSSMFDYLYSIGRQSNPLLGVLGTVIRDAQDERDQELNPIIKRIDGATLKLQKETGSLDSSFMYDESDMFRNPYNWDLYYTALSAEKVRLQDEEGLHGAQLAMAIQEWIENNTENVVVDQTNGRTEKMPILSKYAKYLGDRKAILDYYRTHGGKGKHVSGTWIAEHLQELNANGVIAIYNPVDGLTEAQKAYYDTMMQIKGELGSKLPAYAQQQYLPPQITKDFIDNAGEGKLGEGIKNWAKDEFTISDKDHELNRDYFELGEEKSSVVSGTLNGRVKKYIPLYYTRRLKEGERNNLLKNASSAMTHLAGVAVGYECLSKVEDVANVLGDYITDMVSIAKDAKGENKLEGVETNKVTVIQNLKEKWGNVDTKAIVEGMIDQHFYGYSLKESQAKIAQGKLAKAAQIALKYSSIYNLTVNIKGAVSNLLVGEYQMMLDAFAGSMVKAFGGEADFYSLKDYIWAHDLLFGKNSTTLIDIVSNNTNSYNGLIAEIFDPTMDNFSEKSHKKYRSKAGNIVDKDWQFIGYGSGEHLIHYANMLSMLHHIKVMQDGKEIPLYNAFEMREDENGIKHLVVKGGVTTIDGKEVDKDYLSSIRKRIREANQNMHGSMNSEDWGIIKQHLLGRAASHLRTWMFEHYSRRFRGSHYSAATQSQREGFYVTLGKCIRDMVKYHRTFSVQWDTLDNHQKTNVFRSLGEIAAAFLGTIFEFCGFLDPDKYDTWFERFCLYQAKRLLMDIKASTPLNVPEEGWQMMKNIFPLITTLRKEYYLIGGLLNGDVFETVKSGKHKGDNKYVVGVKRRVLPFWHQIEELLDLESEDNMFTIFQMQYSM